MFSGIVEKQGLVVRTGRRLTIRRPWNDLKHGESVAVAGVCLTVARLGKDSTGFDLVAETLKRTTLGALKRGDGVNLERALKYGDRISGHLVQGHVEGTGRVLRAGAVLRIETDLASRLVSKGSIAIDGVSLTIVDVEPESFTVALIPTTRKITTLGRIRKGAKVNLELDAATKRPAKKSGVTKALLRRAGFL